MTIPTIENNSPNIVTLEEGAAFAILAMFSLKYTKPDSKNVPHPKGASGPSWVLVRSHWLGQRHAQRALCLA